MVHLIVLSCLAVIFALFALSAYAFSQAAKSNNDAANKALTGLVLRMRLVTRVWVMSALTLISFVEVIVIEAGYSNILIVRLFGLVVLAFFVDTFVAMRRGD